MSLKSVRVFQMAMCDWESRRNQVCRGVSICLILTLCQGDVQFPTGYDAFSYSWRDIQGSKFHKSRGQECGPSDGFGPGDTLGFYLELEPQGSSTTMLTQSIADPVRVLALAILAYSRGCWHCS